MFNNYVNINIIHKKLILNLILKFYAMNLKKSKKTSSKFFNVNDYIIHINFIIYFGYNINNKFLHYIYK